MSLMVSSKPWNAICNNMFLHNDNTVILNMASSEKDGMSNPINFDNTDIVPSISANFFRRNCQQNFDNF